MKHRNWLQQWIFLSKRSSMALCESYWSWDPLWCERKHSSHPPSRSINSPRTCPSKQFLSLPNMSLSSWFAQCKQFLMWQFAVYYPRERSTATALRVESQELVLMSQQKNFLVGLRYPTHQRLSQKVLCHSRLGFRLRAHLFERRLRRVTYHSCQGEIFQVCLSRV